VFHVGERVVRRATRSTPLASAVAQAVRSPARWALPLLALSELQNGNAAPSYVAGTRNFYAITRYNWSSYYALAVIELGQAVATVVEATR
ncbi:MAG: lytic murein transglycosylase, partial [Methylibium sp.]|nr:lytic murein transglycosylase [Methylibium sp.]